MLTVLSLMLLTICAAFVKEDERFPALLYCAMSFLFYFCSMGIDQELHIYKVAALFEGVLVCLLYCLRGCLNARIIKYLIPASIGAILMHFYGWMMCYYNQPVQTYNTLVIIYWCIIMAIFIFVGRISGNIAWSTRFFRDSYHQRNSLG